MVVSISGTYYTLYSMFTLRGTKGNISAERPCTWTIQLTILKVQHKFLFYTYHRLFLKLIFVFKGFYHYKIEKVDILKMII